jgi:chaperonin cofactor prefoldin
MLNNNYEDLVERFQEKERMYDHLSNEKDKIEAELNHIRAETENVLASINDFSWLSR